MHLLDFIARFQCKITDNRNEENDISLMIIERSWTDNGLPETCCENYALNNQSLEDLQSGLLKMARIIDDYLNRI